MFEFFDRIREYQYTERENPESNWKRWEALDAVEISDNYHVVTARGDDARKLFVLTFLFSENNFIYGNEENLIEEKRNLMQKILTLKIKSKYICQVDYASIQEIKDNNQTVGYDALLRYEPLTTLAEYEPANDTNANDMAINIIKNIAYALKQMEGENLSHGHINPNNIFVEQENNLTKYILGIPLEDWFKRTDKDNRRNVDNYTAPELIGDRDIPFNVCSDIYSLGLVAYQILNDGKFPFETDGVSNNEAYIKLCSGEEEIPFPAHGSNSLKYIVRKACANDIQDRYKSIDEMLNDLSEVNQTVLNGQFAYLSDPASVCTISKAKKEKLEKQIQENERLQKEREKQENERLQKEREKQEEIKRQQQAEIKRKKAKQNEQKKQAEIKIQQQQEEIKRQQQAEIIKNQEETETQIQPSETPHEPTIETDGTTDNITIKQSKKGCCLWKFLIILGLIAAGVIIVNLLFGDSDNHEVEDSSKSSSYSVSETEQTTKATEITSDIQTETVMTQEQTAAPTTAQASEQTLAQTSAQTSAQTTVQTDVKTVIAITSNPPTSVESIHTYEFVSGKYTWEEAKAYCEQHGGKLATIHSSDDWDSIISVVNNARNSNSELQYVWLGAQSTLNIDNMTLSFSWIDNSDTSYIMGPSFKHWYYNSKIGVSEPSGYDAYSYNVSGELIREPYLMLWYVSSETGSAGQKEWSLNDICDVSDYPNYKNSNMGFVMEKETTVEVNKYSVLKTGTVVTQQDDLNVRSEASLSSQKIGTVKKGSTVNIVGETDGWYKIEYNGSYGYVSMDYINVSGAISSQTPEYYSDVYVSGQINCHGGIVSGYTTSYICEGGESSTVRKSLGDKWHVTAKNMCVNYGITWYELWDSDDGDYYGWVDENYIDFY